MKQKNECQVFLIALLILCLPLIHDNLYAQEESADERNQTDQPGKVTLDIGADFVSRYIWRGIDYGNSPAIQPTLSVSGWGVSLGAWASYGLTRYTFQIDDTTSIDANYFECDLFLSYSYKYFTILIMDYYTPGPIDTLPGANYFNYNNQTTAHTLEASLVFDGPEKFPLQVSVNTLFYGADKNRDSTGVYGLGDKNNFSTYLEASYTFAVKGFEVVPFLGGIPFGSSWYGPYAGITNVGLTVKKEIPVSSNYSLPIRTSLCTNPQAQKIYLVFAITL